MYKQNNLDVKKTLTMLDIHLIVDKVKHFFKNNRL